jgi:hypothetical protein
MGSDITGKRFIVSAENLAYKDLFGFIADSLEKLPPRYEVKSFLWRINKSL